MPTLDPWAGAVLAAVALCFVAEHVRPLRPRVRPLRERLAVNAVMLLLAALTLRLALVPAAVAVATAAETRGLGVLRWLPVPSTLAAVAGFLLLDWTLYVWHRLNHRVPFLWRFHLVHHTDRDLDVSTAFRFHAGELVLSIAWRAAQVALIGVSPAVLLAWEGAVQAATAFHHCNGRLPRGLERALVLLVVTPRMHGVHHSEVEAHTNSNWSVTFSLWDRAHRTLRHGGPDAPVIGLPGYRDPRALTVGRLLALPFGRQRPAWP